jgi:C-terminal processing protease CtpA/Prc
LLEKDVVREKLSVPSVTSSILTGTDGSLFGYLEISLIGEETENLLKQEIRKIKESKIKGLIVDLRGN